MKRIIIISTIISIAAIVFVFYPSKPEYEIVIDEFKDNASYFETIKGYMLTMPKSYYLAPGNVDEVNDQNVKEAAEYLFNKLHYEHIEIYSTSNNTSDYYIIFVHKSQKRTEQGILYTLKREEYGSVMKPIQGDWYYHFIGYV